MTDDTKATLALMFLVVIAAMWAMSTRAIVEAINAIPACHHECRTVTNAVIVLPVEVRTEREVEPQFHTLPFIVTTNWTLPTWPQDTHWATGMFVECSTEVPK